MALLAARRPTRTASRSIPSRASTASIAEADQGAAEKLKGVRKPDFDMHTGSEITVTMDDRVTDDAVLRGDCAGRRGSRGS